MKTIKILFTALLAAGAVSCSDMLDTEPASSLSQDKVFSSAAGAETAVDGIYRSMYKSITTGGYGTENGGVHSIFMTTDLMADDMAMVLPGNQWYIYDYAFYDIRNSISGINDRPYSWWQYLYKVVDASNRIITNAPAIDDDQNRIKNVVGQAYAMRAWAYFTLINLYQHTYVGNESAPGVPVYTEVTDKTTQGKGRGTVEQVYTQINSDLTNAITNLEATTVAQQHISNIDKYVAYGLKARVALFQGKFDDASTYAKKALAKPGADLMGSDDLLAGFNSASNGEWLWGFEVIDSQYMIYASPGSHWDAAAGGHATTCPKHVTNWLYDRIADTDTRKGWFCAPSVAPDQVRPEDYSATVNTYAKFINYIDRNSSAAARTVRAAYGMDEDPKAAGDQAWNQLKFRVKGAGSWASDLVMMRVAEMYLIVAEAECRKAAPDYTTAKQYLQDLMDTRDPDYDASIFPDANSITLETTNTAALASRNILDEILLQRRIELWGEGFRLQDMSRTKSSYSRNYYAAAVPPATVPTGNNHALISGDVPYYGGSYSDIVAANTDFGSSFGYTMMIPLTEFNSNPGMTYPNDQNK